MSKTFFNNKIIHKKKIKKFVRPIDKKEIESI